MPDLHYTDPRLAQLYDADCGPSDESGFYLSLATPAPKRILDLGCGTGWFCNAYAAMGHAVTGVDPATGMLDVARTKTFGAYITWVQATAQTYRSAQRFDLIVMTGHAFQTLVTGADINDALTTMRSHLAPGGTIVFETRNPNCDWASRWNEVSRDQQLDGQRVRQTYEILSGTADTITFATHYAFSDAILSSTSILRFTTHNELAPLLLANGLQLRTLLGAWDKTPFDSEISDEMIFVLGAI